MHTLTRAQVARRLCKSIATVRRLEYRILFPVRDQRGVLRFDEGDVERAGRNPESVRLFARSRWFEDTLRDRAKARHVTAIPRKLSKGRGLPANYSALANDLQQVLGELVLRFDGRHLQACGFDVNLFARAFDAVRRLRAVRPQ